MFLLRPLLGRSLEPQNTFHHLKPEKGLKTTGVGLNTSYQTIIVKQRNILNVSDDLNDEGTNALMSDYISQQEKMVWMYSAYLK